MANDAYLRVLREFQRTFDSERGGQIPYRRDDYSLEPLRRYIETRGALRPARHVLHVGGTKGKGSVTTMLAALLQAAGLRVGSYLSPHLVSYRERIRIDGRPVSEALFAEQAGQVLAEKPDPGGSSMRSVFEVLTAAAALLFHHEQLDAAVIEVGLGGKLDATNVLDTTVSVLTPISLDHTEVLGPTVEAIAADKAGILRAGRPAVLGRQSPEALRVLLERAEQIGAVPIVYGRDYWAEDRENGLCVRFADGLEIDGLRLAMPGAFQAGNAAAALAAFRAALGDPDAGTARAALEAARLAGRMQHVRLEDGRLVVLDGAHNPFAAQVVAREATRLHGKPLAVLLAASSNKDVPGILEPLLPVADPALLCSFGAPRGLPAAELAAIARRLGHADPLVFPTAEEAWRHWLERCGDRPVLLVTGSLFLVGRVLRILHGEGRVELDPEPDPEPPASNGAAAR